MRQEIIKILKMVESKKITIEEGQQLIQAIQNAQQKKKMFHQLVIGRFLHLDVESCENGDQQLVEVNVPLNVAKSFLRLGCIQKQIEAKASDDLIIDVEEIISLMEKDYIGDLVSVETKETKVRIWID